MIQIQLKDVKKGDIFYEKVGLHEYKYEALEDAVDKGFIKIAGNDYKQYMVHMKNEHNEISYLLVTEGLVHYNGKYYKKNGND